MDTHSHVEELDPGQCWTLLSQAPIGRLAVVVDAGPEIFPVNHVVDPGRILFRTAAGTKLFAAVGRGVAFEVDGVDTGSGRAWSVVAKGVAEELDDAVALDDLDDRLVPWLDSEKPHVLVLDRPTLSGRRFALPRAR
jgi:nitroimidazol reductase NimA-like FMN-containing flavoprotein (pyridoxamine 5'-phosphate oxidase superfamily)